MPERRASVPAMTNERRVRVELGGEVLPPDGHQFATRENRAEPYHLIDNTNTDPVALCGTVIYDVSISGQRYVAIVDGVRKWPLPWCKRCLRALKKAGVTWEPKEE